MTITQGSKYVAPKRRRIFVPVAIEDKQEIKYLADQSFTTTSEMVRRLVLEGLTLWEGK